MDTHARTYMNSHMHTHMRVRARTHTHQILDTLQKLSLKPIHEFQVNNPFAEYFSASERR